MKRTLFAFSVYVVCLLLTFLQPAFGEDEYGFDLSEIEKEVEKKPYHIGGFLEFRPVLFGLDKDSAFYKIKFYDKDEGSTLEQYNSRLRLEGSYHKGIVGAFFRADSTLWYGYEGWDGDITLLEGFLALKPGPSFALEAGKRVAQWGKGYAFNTVNFVSRPKDPNDPTEPVEGYYLAIADWIKSFGGPLKTLAFTPVILPVTESINDKFGEPDHINFAAKLYGLLWDTDIDLLFFTGKSRTTRYGMDFARNITENLAVHGEFAWLPGFDKKSIDSQGRLYTQKSDIIKYLLGIRYLTTNNMTFILEYYHNGAGLDSNDADNFYSFVDRAYDKYLSTGNSSDLNKAAKLSQGSLSTFKPFRNYLYFRGSWSEPFDILYFTPAVFSIINLNDRSLSITPELMYNPITNLQLRLRGGLLIGGKNTEFGEKQNDYKVELRVRYFF